MVTSAIIAHVTIALVSFLFVLRACVVQVIGVEAQSTAGLLVNAMITLSYPLNFFIYCAMSRKFRDTMAQLVCRRAAGESGAVSLSEGTALETFTVSVRTDAIAPRRIQTSQL